ncbi:MAG: hypothetical protein GX571_11760 [Lentisphaerae bacterium]|nr:hypothetical protein [Lentisphaerota bacterium]
MILHDEQIIPEPPPGQHHFSGALAITEGSDPAAAGDLLRQIGMLVP